eukprot:1543408-Amphidinium_carterae.1
MDGKRTDSDSPGIKLTSKVNGIQLKSIVLRWLLNALEERKGRPEQKQQRLQSPNRSLTAP